MAETLKCPFCQAAGEKSRVTIGPSSSTCMAGGAPYYDEDGNYQRGYDPNWHTTEYYCARGHRFTIMRRQGDDDVVSLVSTTTVSVTDFGCADSGEGT